MKTCLAASAPGHRRWQKIAAGLLMLGSFTRAEIYYYDDRNGPTRSWSDPTRRAHGGNGQTGVPTAGDDALFQRINYSDSAVSVGGNAISVGGNLLVWRWRRRVA